MVLQLSEFLWIWIILVTPSCNIAIMVMMKPPLSAAMPGKVAEAFTPNDWPRITLWRAFRMGTKAEIQNVKGLLESLSGHAAVKIWKSCRVWHILGCVVHDSELSDQKINRRIRLSAEIMNSLSKCLEKPLPLYVSSRLWYCQSNLDFHLVLRSLILTSFTTGICNGSFTLTSDCTKKLQ